MESSVTFLHLPRAVRIKIFQLSDLTRPCAIDVTLEGQRRSLIEKSKRSHDRLPKVCLDSCLRHLPRPGLRVPKRLKISDDRLLECVCQPLPAQLFYVSRKVYNEAALVLYRDNTFKSSSRQGLWLDPLEPLVTLDPDSLAMLTSLHIGLTAIGFYRDAFPSEDHVPEDFDHRTTIGDRLLRKWDTLCDLLTSRMAPYQLKLSFSCRVQDYDTALRITAPMKRLPPLRTCSLHFGDDQGTTGLKALAKAMVLLLTRKKYRALKTGGWGKLPKELHSQILSYTDLVFDRGPCSEEKSTGLIKIQDGRLYPCTKQCCLKCTESLEVCCCEPLNAAYSDTCECRPLPTALFLVNKQMHEDAKEVLFSRNEFRFCGSFLASTQFLARLSSSDKEHMRHISLGISFTQIYAELGIPLIRAIREWQNLIKMVRDQLPLPKLWLSVDTTGLAPELDMWLAGRDSDLRWLHTAYYQMTKSLYQLRGLKKFHLSLCWSIDYEAVAERAVMGPDYDSIAEGKQVWSSKSYHHLKALRGMRMLEALSRM